MATAARFAIRERDNLRHQLRRMQDRFKALQEICRAAIESGDWQVDGACDPDHLLSEER